MKTLKVVSRKSNLALKQVEEFFAGTSDLKYELITIDTYGDKHKEISLIDNSMEDIFTREIDEIILRGDADIAVHSAKDLPYPLPDGISVIALTECHDKTDALVSKNNRTLENLPSGARIGSSSAARIGQLLELRSDLKPVSIRGTIEERIALIDRGEIDALVVATCALKRLGLDSRIAQILPIKTNDLQGHLAVTARSNRFDLQALFYRYDSRRKWGRVLLTGAGPGGKDTLTIGADRALQRAEIIYYDDLFDNAMLDDYTAEKVFVGKRKGVHEAEQNSINEMLYHSVLEGKFSVRLKGGDPFIFGRGGEEAEYLGRRLVPVEVLPAVTSALAAAADSCIPLTMRSVSASLAFASAHTASGEIPLPSADTLVYYMSASKLKELSSALQGNGWDSATPVALVTNAASAASKTIFTTIENCASVEPVSPMIVIVGKSAGKNYYQKKYLYTGLDPYCMTMPVNGRIVHYPLIRITDFTDPEIKDLTQYDAVVFTSGNAVRLFVKHYHAAGQKIFAIGRSTADELKKYNLDCEISEQPNSESLCELILRSDVKRALYPTSDISENPLHVLSNTERLDLYHVSRREQPLLDLGLFAGILFSSPSTVDSFQFLYKTFPEEMAYYSIGPATTRALKKYNVNPELIIDVQDIEFNQKK